MVQVLSDSVTCAEYFVKSSDFYVVSFLITDRHKKQPIANFGTHLFLHALAHFIPIFKTFTVISIAGSRHSRKFKIGTLLI